MTSSPPGGTSIDPSDETKDELITSINKLETIVCRSLIRRFIACEFFFENLFYLTHFLKKRN